MDDSVTSLSVRLSLPHPHRAARKGPQSVGRIRVAGLQLYTTWKTEGSLQRTSETAETEAQF